MAVIFIALHLALSVSMMIYCRAFGSHISYSMYVILFAVPIVGAILFYTEVIASYRSVRRSSPAKGLSPIPAYDAKREMVRVDQADSSTVVPLEEAMVLKERSARRKLMMEVIKSDTEEHLPILEAASLSDDTELSHYATTAMMRIQSDYEKTLYDLEKQFKKDQSDAEVAEEYRKALKRYIESGLVSGRILDIYRDKYEVVLSVLRLEYPSRISYFTEWMRNRLAMEQYDGLDRELRLAMKEWPQDERCYEVGMEYAYQTYNTELAKNILSIVDEKKVYLSRRGRDWAAFWKGAV